MSNSSFSISHTRKINITDRFFTAAQEAGLFMQTAQSQNGRSIQIDGQWLLNFGSCSYMGLETHPKIRASAHKAIDEYGTQFTFSRGFLQCSLYQELEDLLERMAGQPVLAAPSLSLAHMAALPVLVQDGDTMIVDQFAHSSIQTATLLMPTMPIKILPHNRMDKLESLLLKLRESRGLVWYIFDGLYSMLGDFAPFEDLKRLLNQYDNLRLYIDDAHSTSWLGKNGRGIALEHFANDERVFVTMSLCKAFSAAGGAMAYPNRDVLMRIRRCGGTMLFSGPIQPPMLGAAIGSARVHLSPGFGDLQKQLHQRLEVAVAAMRREELQLAFPSVSTIFQVPCDSTRMVFEIAQGMKERGFYVCVCTFPAVPMNHPGIRFTITRHNEIDDIESFIAALAQTLRKSKDRIEKNRSELMSV